MRSNSRRALVAALLLGVLASVVLVLPAYAQPVMSSVSDKLICLCGCNSVLTECPHQNCEWGIPAKQYITEQLAAGQSPDQLVDYYVEKYGEEVLAAPAKTGFNLAAYLIPFVVLIAGGVVIYFLVAGWVRRMGRPTVVAGPGTIEPSVDEAPDELRRRLDEELDKFD